MKKKNGMIMIALLTFVIGLILSVQINTIQGGEQGGLVPVGLAQAYEADLKKVQAEKEAATQELIALETKMEAIQKEQAEDDTILKALLEEQEKYKIATGTVEVKGPGVVITLSDPKNDNLGVDDYSILMMRYEYILSLVNKLKDAGAEAISINGERIIATTEISLAGDNVNINTRPTAPPYQIKAIGNPDTIESSITIRFGIIEQMKNLGIIVDIAKQEEVIVPRYNGVLRFRYAQSIEE